MSEARKRIRAWKILVLWCYCLRSDFRLPTPV